MLIEKPMCNFKNCRYCFDGNCRDASKYENCTLTDLHSEIARLRVELDNAKADTVLKMHSMLCEGRVSNDTVVIVANQIANELLTEGV